MNFERIKAYELAPKQDFVDYLEKRLIEVRKRITELRYKMTRNDSPRLWVQDWLASAGTEAALLSESLYRIDKDYERALSIPVQKIEQLYRAARKLRYLAQKNKSLMMLNLASILYEEGCDLDSYRLNLANGTGIGGYEVSHMKWLVSHSIWFIIGYRRCEVDPSIKPDPVLYPHYYEEELRSWIIDQINKKESKNEPTITV
jgi:hypothetical protein